MKELRNTKLNILYIPTSDIIPYKNNPRRHSREQIESIKQSVEKLGNRKPIEIDENNVIICGHGRYEAYKALGMESVPVIIHSDLTESEKKQYRIADNELALKSEWDVEILKIEMADIDIASVGFSDKEIRDMGLFSKPETKNDDVVIDDVEPITKKGDLWELNGHKVFCGDSSKIESHNMFDRNYDMVFTDPPYGVSIGDKNRFLNDHGRQHKRIIENIENDNIGKDDLYNILISAFKNIKEKLSDYNTVFMCAPQGGDLGLMMMTMLHDAGIPCRHMIIWKKNSPTFSMGRLDYDYKHEPILMTWYNRHKFYGAGEQKTSVWEYDKPLKCDLHPTMKPVELIVNAIMNNSKNGDIIHDSFLGSGSTLIACEKTGRICYGIELDEHYCDVIVIRWLNWLIDNKKEVKSVKLNGIDFDYKSLKIQSFNNH